MKLAVTHRTVMQRPAWWKKHGVEGVVCYDNTWPDFYTLPDSHFRDAKRQLDVEGLPVGAFNALRMSLHMPALVEYDQRLTDRCLDVCAILKPAVFDLSVNVPIPDGLDAIAFAARPTYRGAFASRDTMELGAERLKRVARRCAEIGAELSLELHDDGIQDTADGILKLIEMIGEPNVGANPDIGNWYRVPYEHPDTWRDQMTKLAPITNYWEVKNYKRIIVPEHSRAYSWNVYLDDGDLDFRSAAVTLWEAGFRGWVCNEGGTGDHVRSNLKYLEYMKWIRDEWIPEVSA